MFNRPTAHGISDSPNLSYSNCPAARRSRIFVEAVLFFCESQPVDAQPTEALPSLAFSVRIVEVWKPASCRTFGTHVLCGCRPGRYSRLCACIIRQHWFGELQACQAIFNPHNSCRNRLKCAHRNENSRAFPQRSRLINTGPASRKIADAMLRLLPSSKTLDDRAQHDTVARITSGLLNDFRRLAVFRLLGICHERT